LPAPAGIRRLCRPAMRRAAARFAIGGVMGSVALLIAGTLLVVPSQTGRTLPLQLERGQEFVYHSRYIPQATRPGVNDEQWLDTYVLILEATPRSKAQAAFMTVQRVKAGAETVPVARLELGSIDEMGRV